MAVFLDDSCYGCPSLPPMQLLAYGSRFAVTPSAEKEGTRLACSEWASTFEAHHRDDAHAVGYLFYQGSGLSQDQWRLPADLSGLDGEVRCHFIFLDIDGISHEAAFSSLQRLPESSPCSRVAVLYLTKGGIRIVYRLSKPVRVEEFGPLVRGVAMELWVRTALSIDPTSDQWTRMFRLPSVTRADEKATGPTWEAAYYTPPLIDEAATLDPTSITPRDEKLPWATSRAAQKASAPRPEDTESLSEPEAKAYRRILRSSRFSPYLFDNFPIPEGRRDPTLLAMAGEIVAKAYSAVPDSGPDRIFLLLRPMVQCMENDGSESWEDKAWRLVSHAWSEQARKEEERLKRETLDLSDRDRVVEALLEKLPQDEIPQDPVLRTAYAKRHYCLQVPSGAFAIRRDGTYTTVALRPTQLPAHFNDGLQFLQEGGFFSESGTPMSGQAILDSFSTNLDGVDFVGTLDAPARVTKVGDRRVLTVSPFRIRADLLDSAEFDRDIDGWLDCFPDPVLIRRWLAASVAIDLGGVAALYLIGPRRAGKSMLAQGIADIFHGSAVPGAQAFAEFNGALFESPVVLVDEGLPTRLTGMDVADLFRSLVTGGPVQVMKKRQDGVTSRIPYRVVFAANSFDMVRQLIGKRTLNPLDRDALHERILVVETGQAPATYLDSHGAMEFTRYSAKGSWIGGECRLARHILKLYLTMFKESSFERAGRLLVEGRPHPSFTSSFDLSGMGREVLDDLIEDIGKVSSARSNSRELLEFMVIEGGCVWIKKRPYVRFACRRAGRSAGEGYTVALERFLTEIHDECPRDGSRRTKVDIQKILFSAREEGSPVSFLEKVYLAGAS